MNKPITTAKELQEMSSKYNDDYYYIRNKQGVIYAMREKEAWRFKRKCQWYKENYNQDELKKLVKDKTETLQAIYNYLYPDD